MLWFERLPDGCARPRPGKARSFKPGEGLNIRVVSSVCRSEGLPCDSFRAGVLSFFHFRLLLRSFSNSPLASPDFLPQSILKPLSATMSSNEDAAPSSSSSSGSASPRGDRPSFKSLRQKSTAASAAAAPAPEVCAALCKLALLSFLCESPVAISLTPCHCVTNASIGPVEKNWNADTSCCVCHVGPEQ